MKHSLRQLFMLPIFFIAVVGCEQEPEDLFIRTFTIQKDEHYSTPKLVESLQASRLVFVAEFDNSAIYSLSDPSQQSNKNKLLGFSECNSMHHQNSARFGWQWLNGQLEIFAYCYVDGQRVEKFIGTVPLNTMNRYEIQIKENSYVFSLNEYDAVTIPRTNDRCDRGFYYMLWPYFGGTLPAPHNINIQISIDR
jgi:hypothetical protein